MYCHISVSQIVLLFFSKESLAILYVPVHMFVVAVCFSNTSSVACPANTTLSSNDTCPGETFIHIPNVNQFVFSFEKG